MILEYVIIAVLGYLLGSINASILVSKLIYKKDIRDFGSGNAGTTNMLRTFGKGAALLVLIIDILKGVFAALIGNSIAGGLGMLVGGLFAIFGHNWPVYFKFKGGKGILTSASVLFVIDWRIALLLTAIVLIIIAITRYVSLGSIIGCILAPFCFYFISNYRGIDSIQVLAFITIIAALGIFRHRTNIKKLISGTESKLGQKAVSN